MTSRIAARIRLLGRGGALIVALGVAMLAGEKTPAAAPTPYYKILNLGTFHASAYCSQAVCESHAADVNIWARPWGGRASVSSIPIRRSSERFAPPPMPQSPTESHLCGGFNLCDSKALDINIHSHVVGTSETTGSGNGDPHAFLHKGSTMTDINTLLSPSRPSGLGAR